MSAKDFLIKTDISDFLLEDLRKAIPNETALLQFLSEKFTDSKSIVKAKKTFKSFKKN